MDRIDIHIEVPPVKYHEISSIVAGEKSSIIRSRVLAARDIQRERFKGLRKVRCNAAMRTKELHKFCAIKPDAQNQANSERPMLNGRAEKNKNLLWCAIKMAHFSCI